jgi:hypothetical protein
MQSYNLGIVHGVFLGHSKQASLLLDTAILSKGTICVSKIEGSGA